jgi:hypothetical protein
MTVNSEADTWLVIGSLLADKFKYYNSFLYAVAASNPFSCNFKIILAM